MNRARAFNRQRRSNRFRVISLGTSSGYLLSYWDLGPIHILSCCHCRSLPQFKMKAIWSTCTRGFSLPGLKRSREDDAPGLVIPGSKRAKSEHLKIMRNVDIDGESY
jgi:hypothetical protein